MGSQELRKEIEKYLNPYSSGKLLPLMLPSYGIDEVMEVVDSLLSYWITKGPKVKEFERTFKGYLGSRFAVMLNSGSSANFLAMKILSEKKVENHIRPGDEVIVPAVTWSTTLFPVYDVGALPVLVDVGEDYQLDVEKVLENVTPRTRAIFAVHLLGDVCDIGALRDIAEDHRLFLIEDTCEALGAEYRGKKAGTFGDIGTFSFYFSHHITTGEGGMLVTDNETLADLAYTMRAHGYVREAIYKDKYIQESQAIDPRFLFVSRGYNFRPTDIQGAFGIHQLKKLEGFLEKRKEFALKLAELLKKYSDFLMLPREKPKTRHSWFVFPILLKDGIPFSKEELVRFLESKGIETRPIVAGNLAMQPAIREIGYRGKDLKRSEKIMKDGFYIGVHPVGKELAKKVAEVFDEFFQTKL